MTEKGKNLARNISVYGNKIQTIADENITQEELASFYVTLEKLSGNLFNISKELDSGCQDSVLNIIESD